MGDSAEEIQEKILKDDYDEDLLNCSEDGKNLLMMLL